MRAFFPVCFLSGLTLQNEHTLANQEDDVVEPWAVTENSMEILFPHPYLMAASRF